MSKLGPGFAHRIVLGSALFGIAICGMGAVGGSGDQFARATTPSAKPNEAHITTTGVLPEGNNGIGASTAAM